MSAVMFRTCEACGVSVGSDVWDDHQARHLLTTMAETATDMVNEWQALMLPGKPLPGVPVLIGSLAADLTILAHMVHVLCTREADRLGKR